MTHTSLLPEPNVTITAASPDAILAGKVRSAFERALANDGKLTDGVFAIPGASGRKYRLFINNLVESIPNSRYLEIGVWQGSTLCAAIFDNEPTVTAIDNWSQFGGPASTFLENLAKFKGKSKVSFLERNFREVDFHHLGEFNIYLFDGPHSYRDQYDGIVLADPALDQTFALIVDDWNWEQVRRGTLDGISHRGYQVEYSIEIRTTLDNTHARVHGGDWHNGYFIAAIKKP